jgi:hypothetical protein
VVSLIVGIAAMAVPDVAAAAFKAAAGGGGGGGSFGGLVGFLDRLADRLIPVGLGFGVLGVLWGGGQLIAGNPQAGRTLALVGLGMGVVLLSKGIAA